MSSFIFSKLESDRFNLNIYRYISEESFDYRALKNDIIESKADIVFARLNSAQKDLNRKIFELGFPVLHADTLVYYSCNLESIKVNPIKNNLKFEEINMNNVDVLRDLVEKIFDNYTNHYWSNSFLDKQAALEGYIEWASSFKESFDKKAWLVIKDSNYIGFATCSIDESVGEGVLYGVLPENAGGGVYTDIIRFTQQKLKDKGCFTMKVSTQIQNYAVQKVWCREGFYLYKSYDTYHINAMLNCTGEKDIKENIHVNESDIYACVDFSGDYNPIHSSVETAKKLGFDDKVVHGIFLNAIQSRIFGTRFPGIGTLYSGIQHNFVKPIYINQDYQMTNKVVQAKREFYLVVSIVTNQKDEICLVSYNQLIKKQIDSLQ